MIAVETIYAPDGQPVGKIRCHVEKSTFRFEPTDPKDSRFTGIQGRRYASRERLRARVKAACEACNG